MSEEAPSTAQTPTSAAVASVAETTESATSPLASPSASSSSASSEEKEKSVAQAKLDLAEKDDDRDDDDETSGSSNGPKSSLPDTSSLGKKKVLVKVGMIGDSEIGKTSLMVKYVQGNFNEDYIQTLGVNFMEKTINLKKTDMIFSIWDLGGHKEYLHMLPLVCNDALALLFMFDLSRKSTLTRLGGERSGLLPARCVPVLITNC